MKKLKKLLKEHPIALAIDMGGALLTWGLIMWACSSYMGPIGLWKSIFLLVILVIGYFFHWWCQEYEPEIDDEE